MSDPGGEPLPPAQTQSGTPRPDVPSGTPAHLTPAPRVHPPSIHHPREPQTPGATPPPPPGFSEALEWIRLHGNVEADLPEAPGRTRRSSRSLLPKDQRKFHKFDPEQPKPRSAAPQRRASDLPDDASGELAFAPDYPRVGITAAQLDFIRRLRQGAPGNNPWLPVGVAILVFLLMVGAFFVAHSKLARIFTTGREPAVTSQKPAIGGQVSAGLNAVATDLIDQAMAAETAQNYPKAIEFLERAQQNAGHVDGLDYQMASLYYKSNDLARALPRLNFSISENEEVAACCSLRGTINGQTTGVNQGLDDLERATRLDPFNARYFFVWSEALRRVGKPQAALVQLGRAIDRLREPALLAGYLLKVRLTQIELGEADLFAAEMAARLQLDPPPAEWLVTAAAVEMHRGNFAVAADDLAKVSALVGPAATAAWLQDVYFTNFAHEKLLAGFFEVPTLPARTPGSGAP